MTGATYAAVCRSRHPSQVWDREWADVLSWLTDWRRAPEKREAPCWSPHRLSRPVRELAAVVEISALVLDYDHGDRDPDAIAASLYPYEVLAYATWSSTLEAPRVRAVLPMAAPVPAARWRGVYQLVVEGIGAGADPACSDPTRIHVLPVVGPGGDTRMAHRRGRPVDLGAYVAEVERRASAQEQARRQKEIADAYRRATAAPWRRLREDLRTDPEARARYAREVGASVGAESARRAPCPKCGDRSVWWPLRPEKMHGAACSHRNSCGWTGPIEEVRGG